MCFSLESSRRMPAHITQKAVFCICRHHTSGGVFFPWGKKDSGGQPTPHGRLVIPHTITRFLEVCFFPERNAGGQPTPHGGLVFPHTITISLEVRFSGKKTLEASPHHTETCFSICHRQFAGGVFFPGTKKRRRPAHTARRADFCTDQLCLIQIGD